MKKLVIALLALGVSTSLFAQEQPASVSAEPTITVEKDYDSIWKKKRTYLNLGYVNQELNFADMDDAKFKSNWGASISSGKTFYLHKKPLGGVVKFGLDWTWADVNVAGYDKFDAGESDFEYDDEYYEDEDDMPSWTKDTYQFEIGMQVGPSITINPVDKLKISAYFRVTPSYSAIYCNEELYSGFAAMLNPGVSVAWKLLSFGFEYRTGQAKYKNFVIEGMEDEEIEEYEVGSSADKLKMKTEGFRFYFGFRF